jgi:prophage regulatory protein
METERIQDTNPDRLIRIEQVKELTTLSKSSINAWVAAGRFPAPRHLSPTIKVWRYRDITEWMQNALEQGGGHAKP